jgi:6-phosphogluconolactonase/glucosamine-6-phosphate isomerase/deaminase
MTKEDKAKYVSPELRYFKNREEFDSAVGEDFIQTVNKQVKSDNKFLVGLSHGQSPSGAYRYILANYAQIKHPELIRYTFVNTALKRQRDLKEHILDAKAFLRALVSQKLLEKKEIIGSALHVPDKEAYATEFNKKLGLYLKEHNKDGLDYVFLATNPAGHVAGISRKSQIFDSVNIVEIVNDRLEKEITFTPFFLCQSKRIAFLATKADKRRALAWLLHKNGKPDESPSFLRFIDNVEKRLFVFIDDAALTWPQISIERKTRFGISTIKVDLSKSYNANAKNKLPVLLLIHGFLGLNSFDGILTHLPTHKYIAAAMHYGSVPAKLEVERYSKHVVNNIDAVVAYFGEKGHPVYLFDHSMGNIYFMMMNKDFNRLKGIQQYLCGRIGANPFFGKEAKHAVIGFLDNVILPALSIAKNPIEKSLFVGFRSIVPLDTKKGVRKRGINLTDMLIRRDSGMRDRIWKAMKGRIFYLMTTMDSLPQLNKIPIERALHRLPAKLFVIQIYSALLESIDFDKQIGYPNMLANDIPILILQSENDCIAKYEPQYHSGSNVEVIDVTNHKETDLFKEHLYHMVFLDETIELIDKFIIKVEKKRLVEEIA